MTKTLYNSKYDCCGCTACYSVCPVNAIRMVADDEGFQYPVVNQSVCVNCKMCESVCPLRAGNKHSDPINVYAAKNKQEAVRLCSSSGGIFSLLADYIEAQGGVIYGAAFDEQFTVRHMRTEAAGEWKKFCVSKYTQSDMGNTFWSVRADLDSGRMVLFSGTPCQVDGLKRYLKGARVSCDGLVTCDIVCHGTPSPKVWADYLDYLVKRTGRQIGCVSFRDKEKTGWHNSTLTIKDGKEQMILKETMKENFFSKLFFSHLILRPSCHRCQYAGFRRPGDFTLGDFWGIEKNHPRFDDDKGISLVMVHTEKGQKIWQEIQSGAESFPVTKEQCVQPPLVAPSQEHPDRESFWCWYQRYGFQRTGQWMEYLPASKVEKLLLFFYRVENKLRRFWKK